MKRQLLFLVVASIGMTANAQQTDKQMATLQHGDQTTVYYGIDAFKQAYDNAADTLDVITLSSGEFNVPDKISKSIAVYGAGFERDTITGTDRTYLRGRITLIPADIVDGDGQTVKAAKRVNGVHLEGLNIYEGIYAENNANKPIYNLQIVKCGFSSLDIKVSSYDCSVRQSSIKYISGNNYASNFYISNCYVNTCISGFYNNSTIYIDHCILCRGDYGQFGPYTYTNNIIYRVPDTGYTSYNNIFVSNGSPTQDDYGNWNGVPNAALWATEGEDGSYAANKDFQLKYPDKYRGNDGTEIGLHGGTYAWNKIPCLPRITECTIDTKDAANGTIKLSLKAEAQTKE